MMMCERCEEDQPMDTFDTCMMCWKEICKECMGEGEDKEVCDYCEEALADMKRDMKKKK